MHHIVRKSFWRSAKPGFTFTELLVVIFIYSILLASTVDIFVQAQRAQRKVAALEKLQDDARFLVQTISQVFQAGGFDYTCYQHYENSELKRGSCDKDLTKEPDGVDVLAVKNFEGKTTQFKHSEDSVLCGGTQNTPCILTSDDDGATWVRASSEGVKVTKLRFYISPSQNPFELDEQHEYRAHEQPKLTIALDATSAIRGFKETASIAIQTTLSSREYKR